MGLICIACYMKKYFFIPTIILLIALKTVAQPHLQIGAVNIHHTDSKKLHFRSSPATANSIHLPADGIITAYLNGQLLFKGQVKKQKLQEDWASFYRNSHKLDSGYLRNSVPDGEWKRWDSSGKLIAIRNYDADKLHQVKEEMRMAHPKRSFYSLTALYKINRSQAMHALTAGYSFSFSATQPLPQTLQQVVENNSTNENSYIPVFNECLHHGLYMNFFPGAITKDSGYYKNGLKEAVWLHRNSPAGNYYIGTYKNGIPIREWKLYNEAGRLLSIIFYNKEGREEWRKSIHR